VDRRSPYARPLLDEAVEQAVGSMIAQIRDVHPRAAALFRQCYLNTLETTTELVDDGTTFVFTGDIPAMWLRDSAAQVRPYVRLAAGSALIRRVLSGLIRRHAAAILVDPYANAFNLGPNGRGHRTDRPRKSRWVWERKFEIDSLCYPIQLCKDYWEATHDRATFDHSVRAMFRRVLATLRTEQHHEQESHYRFQRPLALTWRDTLRRGGRGAPVRDTGMVWSGFRPSDDACEYGFNIPGNMFAVVALGHVATLALEIYGDAAMAAEARELSDQIERAIQTHGLHEHPRYGPIYAYETDGLGQHKLMDDANVPNLLAIPYLGYRPADDPIYRQTRAFVLSAGNPYYVQGAYASGLGSPHTPKGSIWPLGLIVQGLTATDRDEQLRLVDTLVATTAGTGYMHESFDPNRPERFTRAWFAWANSLFAELLLALAGMH
jgi:meiotically up-regulated gene 157 (Mug157) protein